MDYEKAIDFTGNVKKALEVARNVFIQHSFEIVDSSDSAIELTATGIAWTKWQIPLVGISKVRIYGTTRNVSIEAEFGGIRKTTRFTILLILGLAVFFLVTFGILFIAIQGQPADKIILISLAPFVPWPVIIPIMARFMKYRTSQALDALLHNMSVVGKQA